MTIPSNFTPVVFQPGYRLFDGTDMNTNFTIALFDTTATNGITAHAGGGQALAVPVTTAINRITVVATASDSVGLPLAQAGLSLAVSNAGTNAMQVFAAVGSTDTINGTAGSTGVSIAAGKTNYFVAAAPGVWSMMISA